jgi:hypothetical protein
MSSDDPFQFFGLDRRMATSADVKRAYAVRLKATRPEDDPQGFMHLRGMLERGLNEVRWRDLYGDEDDEDTDEDTYDQASEDADDAPGDDYDPHAEDRAIVRELVLSGRDIIDEPEADGKPFERRNDRHPSLTERTHPAFNRPPIVEDEDPDRYEPSDEDLIEEETDPSIIDGVMDEIIELLTGPWGGAARKSLQDKLDAPEISGIDDYQDLSVRVREFLCDRSGFYIDGLKTPMRPPWLTADVMDAFESHFGWSRQTSSMTWEQKQNSWVSRLVHAGAIGRRPDEESEGALPVTTKTASERQQTLINRLIWIALIVVALRVVILFFQ